MTSFHSGMGSVTVSENFIRLTGPAIPPKERHKIEDALKGLGFDVDGGGTNLGDNKSDIFLVRTDFLSKEAER